METVLTTSGVRAVSLDGSTAFKSCAINWHFGLSVDAVILLFVCLNDKFRFLAYEYVQKPS